VAYRLYSLVCAVIVSLPVVVNYHFPEGSTIVTSGADKDRRAVGFDDAATGNLMVNDMITSERPDAGVLAASLTDSRVKES
jgi:hypothetical protein